MKKVILLGGLGNQMFQYALYMSLVERGKKVILDTSLFSYTKMHNGYELEKCFGINSPKVKVTKWRILKLRFFLKYRPKTSLYNDKSYFDEEVFKTKSNYLYGYWQSEKYFLSIKSKIQEVFQFKNIDSENMKLSVEMHNSASVSIHLRRGDYEKTNLYSGICTEFYYVKAIKRMIKELGSSKKIKFFVFSDDKDYCQEFFSGYKISVSFITINKNNESYKDMYLMSQCSHNIIANSSFSWWGAWLNSNPNKIVIAPEKWFNSNEKELGRDIVPKDWIKISNI